jgi:hypothetical protein
MKKIENIILCIFLGFYIFEIVMKHFIFVLVILFVSSCGENKYLQTITVDEHYCEVDTVIGMYRDSSFFGFISCMQYFDNKIYALDVEQKQVSVFSENFDTLFFIGRSGHGPGEFSSLCGSIYVYNDTLYVLNASNVQRFYKGKYTDVLMSPIIREGGRFVYISGKYYIPYPTLTSTFVAATDTTLTSEFVYKNLLYAGMPVKYDDELRTIHNNHRSLLTHNRYIYLFSFNFPVIEKYDIETLELLQSFDLSNIFDIQQNMKYAESLSLPPNAAFSYIKDGYVSDSILYLLYTPLHKKKESITTTMSAILRISLYPEMQVLDILKFEGYNTTLCITPEYIFTFEVSEYLIKRYKKPVQYQ